MDKFSPFAIMAVNKRKRHRLRRLLIFILCCTSFFFFLHSDFFSLQRVEVEGNRRVPVEEIYRLTGLEVGTNLWRIDTKGVVTRLKNHPLLETVSVKRKWPHTLVIYVHEREPLALLPGPGIFWVLDGGGYIMESISHITSKKLPLISGVQVKGQVGPGTKLEDLRLEVALDVLKALPPQAREEIEEIQASDPENLLLYLPERIKVKFGDATSVEDKWERLQGVLKDTNQLGLLEYIDVSFNGPPVIKLRQKR